jgi:hypothetical protein
MALAAAMSKSPPSSSGSFGRFTKRSEGSPGLVPSEDEAKDGMEARSSTGTFFFSGGEPRFKKVKFWAAK